MYWDTSAVLKLYAPEPDTPYYLQLIDAGGGPILSSAILSVELLCAFHRKESAGDLPRGGALLALRQFHADVGGGLIVTVPYGNDISTQAERIVQGALGRRRPIMIRSLDLIHVASALVSKAESLVATDTRLREVARLAGLKLVP